jgi:hypothetical protein
MCDFEYENIIDYSYIKSHGICRTCDHNESGDAEYDEAVDNHLSKELENES